MAIDKIGIGVRVRELRENLFKETRSVFADRCNMTETHIGQIERGEIIPSIIALDKIASSTGADLNYIMYGKPISNNERSSLNSLLDRSNIDELKMYYKCIASINGYICKVKLKL